eukprot:PhM_4_TR18851/c0_g1_i1/m.43446
MDASVNSNLSVGSQPNNANNTNNNNNNNNNNAKKEKETSKEKLWRFLKSVLPHDFQEHRQRRFNTVGLEGLLLTSRMLSVVDDPRILNPTSAADLLRADALRRRVLHDNPNLKTLRGIEAEIQRSIRQREKQQQQQQQQGQGGESNSNESVAALRRLIILKEDDNCDGREGHDGDDLDFDRRPDMFRFGNDGDGDDDADDSSTSPSFSRQPSGRWNYYNNNNNNTRHHNFFITDTASTTSMDVDEEHVLDLLKFMTLENERVATPQTGKISSSSQNKKKSNVVVMRSIPPSATTSSSSLSSSSHILTRGGGVRRESLPPRAITVCRHNKKQEEGAEEEDVSLRNINNKQFGNTRPPRRVPALAAKPLPKVNMRCVTQPHASAAFLENVRRTHGQRSLPSLDMGPRWTAHEELVGGRLVLPSRSATSVDQLYRCSSPEQRVRNALQFMSRPATRTATPKPTTSQYLYSM